MSKPKVSPIQTRAAVVSIDSATNTVRAALSSEQPVQRMFGTEVLSHTAEAIDMSRAADGLPLTVNHSERDLGSPELPIGRVRNFTLDADGKTRGTLDFDTDERAQEVRGKVERGVAPDVSLTYRIDDYEGPDKEGLVTATRWTPLAASIVTMPADASVGVGRSLDPEEAAMPTETPPEAGTASDDIITTVRQRASSGHAAGREAEAARQVGIRDQAIQVRGALGPETAAELDELERHAAATPDISVEQFRSLVLELIGGHGHALTPETTAARAATGTYQPPRYAASSSLAGEPAPHAGRAFAAPGQSRQPLIVPGADHADNLARGIELSMLERAGCKVDADESRGNRFRGWSTIDMARAMLEAGGVPCMGLSSEQIAKAAIGSRAISPGTAAYDTTDFPAVTANVLTKRVNDAFMAAEVTWSQWCSTIEVPDFKQFDIPRLSQINSLPTVAENAAYVNLTQADAREQNTLIKRGGLISWSWEAMVNDDMSMLMRTADRLGEAAARTLDEGAFGVLTTNGNMSDTNPLFDALHSNTGTDALDFDGIVATRTRMARQTDENAQLLGVILRYVIVPEELREQANQLAGAEYLPTFREVAGTAETGVGGAQRVNTLRSTFEVIASVRLTDVNDWYAQGAIGQGVEIAFLAGNRNPAIERESGWDTDAMHYKVRHPSIAYPIDWRGLQRNVVT